MEVMTCKVIEDMTCPAGVITIIGVLPEGIPAGIVALIVVGETTVNAEARPPIATSDVPVKFVPVIVIVVPGEPLVGEKPVIVGTGDKTVNVVRPLVAVPLGVVMLTTPDAALAGTVTLTVPSRLTVYVAGAPPILTDVAPVRFVPVTIMTVPGAPEVGVKPVIVGVGGVVTVNTIVLAPVPAPVVIVITPVCAPAGTTAVMLSPPELNAP